jgi:hypothetical protein
MGVGAQVLNLENLSWAELLRLVFSSVLRFCCLAMITLVKLNAETTNKLLNFECILSGV